MTKKTTTAEPNRSIDSVNTIEHTDNKVNKIMDDMRTAAANLDNHINSLKKAGFFELEMEVHLANNEDNEELIIDPKGSLIHRYIEKQSSMYDEGSRSSFSNVVQTVKAVRLFDVNECIRNIHVKLDELLPIAAQKRKESEVGLEHVEMRPDSPKSLPPRT